MLLMNALFDWAHTWIWKVAIIILRYNTCKLLQYSENRVEKETDAMQHRMHLNR